MKIRLKILGDFDFDETWPIASFVHLIGREKILSKYVSII
jgi:hypothetical protein